MSRLPSRLRRPSAPMLVALLALFVALGGPAQAKRLLSGKDLRKGSVTSRQIRDHTLRSRDLRKGSVTAREVHDHSLRTEDLRKSASRSLRRTPNGSITEAKIRNGAITPGKLARGAVGSQAIADRSVGSGDIAQSAVGGFEVADASLSGADVTDGTLDARDIGRFWGHFKIHVGPVPQGQCWRGDPVGLAPERSQADINGDVVLVTPGNVWPDKTDAGLTFTAHPSTTVSRFTLVACNPTRTLIDGEFPFNYVVIDVP